eukprot:NODE_10473_length_1349_cov_3.301146.p1 GENE.NODE_10473_length_1349_cov_3.301146~~NODE_10473_length_1349_cov_3.301146.p1  ORF type:complete len:369 (-),score=76.78 NODE_10473_length_1349_cov_3.301146:243-1205(-)
MMQAGMAAAVTTTAASTPKPLCAPRSSPRPVCKYGRTCYQKSPAHLADFAHPWMDETSTPTPVPPPAPTPLPTPMLVPPAALPRSHTVPTPNVLQAFDGAPPSSSMGRLPAELLSATTTRSSTTPSVPPVLAPTTSGSKAAAVKLVCRFGKECISKNPKHFAEFSHPWIDSETPEEAKERTDLVQLHEMLTKAKLGEWDDVRKFLTEKPNLINVRPETRPYGFIHFGAANGAPMVEWLIGMRADLHMKTSNGEDIVQVMVSAVTARPPKNEAERRYDEESLMWLQKKLAGDPTATLPRLGVPASSTGAPAQVPTTVYILY